MNLTIIGAGDYGQALAFLAKQNGHSVVFYDKKNPKPSLEEALEFAEAIILALPSAALPELLEQIPPASRALPLISASKGLFSLDVFKDFPRLSILSGPGFADDIMAGKEATLTATSKLARELFQTTAVAIEVAYDPLGVALCGTLKNIYAIGAGLFLNDFGNFALPPQDVRQIPTLAEKYLQTALAETKLALRLLGASPDTANLACGIGDLTLSVVSARSRNYQLGKLLAIGSALPPGKTFEGLSALRRLPAKLAPLPLISSIKQEVDKCLKK
jgi:glycerol-3-phosphate dehydrogenase (NAD(P)+)